MNIDARFESDDPDDPGGTLSEYAEANADTPGVVEALRALKVGESVTIGGGASPAVRLTRLS